MSIDSFPIGLEMDVSYPEFQVSIALLPNRQLRFHIEAGPFKRLETVDIHVVPLGNSIFAVSWKEQSGSTVTNVQDFDRELVHSHITFPDGKFLRMTGTVAITRKPDLPMDRRPLHNKAMVLDAMTSLFQRHDASAVERLYAKNYVQHNPNIPQGRAALKSLVEALAADVYYEPGLMVAEENFVAIHGRIRGWAAEPQVVVDLFRIEEGKLAEHWDVLQDYVPAGGEGRIGMFDPEEASDITTGHSSRRQR